MSENCRKLNREDSGRLIAYLVGPKRTSTEHRAENTRILAPLLDRLYHDQKNKALHSVFASIVHSFFFLLLLLLWHHFDATVASRSYGGFA